jgi:hypothetical protein
VFEEWRDARRDLEQPRIEELSRDVGDRNDFGERRLNKVDLLGIHQGSPSLRFSQIRAAA